MLEADVIEHIKEGSVMLGQDLVDTMESSLSLFQQFCMATCLNVPPVLPFSDIKLVISQRAILAAVPASAERELDAKLTTLRSEIRQVGTEKARLEQNILALDKELKEHGESLIRLTTLKHFLSSNCSLSR